MRKERLGHLLRLLLIALLIVSAALLARASGYYDELFHRLPAAVSEESGNADGELSLSAAELAEAVRPRTVLVCREGKAVASAYSGEATEAEFHRFSAILGEALGSAGEPEEISEKEFRGGLESGSVFMDFSCGMPLELLAEWLGSEMSGKAGSTEVQFLYLGLSDGAVQLCYRDGDGRFCRCTTAAVSETLDARMGDFQGVSAEFAYGDRSLKHLDPYTVLLSALPEFSGVAGAAVRDGINTEELMQTFGMNSYVVSSYTEADGTRVYIENEKSLRVHPDGAVVFRAGSADGERSIAEGLTAAVSYAYAAAKRSIGQYAGEADVLLSGIATDGTDQYTVTFDYCIGSVPLRMASGSAAQFSIKDGILTDARLSLRYYLFTDTAEKMLPMRFAAAIADAAGTTPTLVYADGGDQISCIWVKD